MKVSNNFEQHKHSILFILWIITTLCAGVYFVQARLVWFDPHGVLHNVSSTLLLDTLAKTPALAQHDFSNTFVHFVDKSCQCSAMSETHKKELTLKAQQLGFNVITVEVSQELKDIIPSTPAALIVTQAHKLVYFGPYSVGLACASGNSLIDTALHNYQQGFSSDLIEHQARGCYCNV